MYKVKTTKEMVAFESWQQDYWDAEPPCPHKELPKGLRYSGRWPENTWFQARLKFVRLNALIETQNEHKDYIYGQTNYSLIGSDEET